jgi:hypothetical protein
MGIPEKKRTPSGEVRSIGTEKDIFALFSRERDFEYFDYASVHRFFISLVNLH